MSFDERFTGIVAEALHEHPTMRDQPVIVTGYVVIAEFSDSRDDAKVFMRALDSQRDHRTLGLLDFATTLYQTRLANTIVNDEEEDE